MEIVKLVIKENEYFLIREENFDEYMSELIEMYEENNYKNWQEIEDFICEHFTELEFYDEIIL